MQAKDNLLDTEWYGCCNFVKGDLDYPLALAPSVLAVTFSHYKGEV